jgi:acyl-CoA thioesterase
MSDGSDIAWLGLDRRGEGRWSFELTSPLTRHDGKLYGGAGIAVSVATMEAETARDALWTTTQFVGQADMGDRINCHVETLARGRRTSQVRVTGTVNDQIVFTALGATGETRQGPIEIQVGTMPDVAGPEHGESWLARHRHWQDPDNPTSWFQIAEMRHVDEGRYIWARMHEGGQTRATISFLADMVPSAVARAAGKMGGGTSLDNSIRYGAMTDTDWILLDMDPYFGSSGYLHGAARIWAQDGTLLAVASQTATAMVWEGEIPPWLNQQGRD